MVGVHGDVTQVLGLGIARHEQTVLVVGVEYSRVLRHLHHDALDLRQILQGVYPFQAQVIGLHVEHGANVAALIAHTPTQQATTGGLQDGHVHGGVAQDHARRHGSGHVPFHGLVSVDVDRVRCGQTHVLAGQLEDVRDHARGRGLAIGAGDRRDGNARRLARREEHVQYGTRHVARGALARSHMHAKAGGRVDLADGPAGGSIGLGDITGQEVHARHIQTDGAGGALGHLAVVRVDHIGHVHGRATSGEVSGGAQVHDLLASGHGLGRHVLQFKQAQGLVVQIQSREHFLMADPAPGILIGHLHQLRDGVLPVPHHVTWHALGRGHQLAIHDEESVIEPGDETLHQHGAAVLAGVVEGHSHARFVHQLDGYAAAMVGVEWLEDNRIADAGGGLHGLPFAVDHALARDGQPQVAEQGVGLLLVRCDLHADMARLAGDRGLDATAKSAVTKLDQAVAVQAQPGNIPLLGGTPSVRARPPARGTRPPGSGGGRRCSRPPSPAGRSTARGPAPDPPGAPRSSRCCDPP